MMWDDELRVGESTRCHTGDFSVVSTTSQLQPNRFAIPVREAANGQSTASVGQDFA